MADVSILDQRRIEARFAGQMLKTLEAELGTERARAILAKAIIALAHSAGAEFAAAKPGNEKGENPPDLSDLASITPLWQKEDALRIEWLEQSPDKLSFNITRCRYAETSREMGLGDIGDLLSCNRDGEFCKGYNPKIQLKRTQTIMKGATHCDFRYTMAKD
jgi:hypothetical protein